MVEESAIHYLEIGLDPLIRDGFEGRLKFLIKEYVVFYLRKLSHDFIIFLTVKRYLVAEDSELSLYHFLQFLNLSLVFK